MADVSEQANAPHQPREKGSYWLGFGWTFLPVLIVCIVSAGFVGSGAGGNGAGNMDAMRRGLFGVFLWVATIPFLAIATVVMICKLVSGKTSSASGIFVGICAGVAAFIASAYVGEMLQGWILGYNG